MTYKVVILPAAQMRLDRYIAYTRNVLKNRTAAKNIASDARETKKRLAEIAPSLALCPNEELASLGYRPISETIIMRFRDGAGKTERRSSLP